MKKQRPYPGFEYEKNFVFQADPIVHAVTQVAPFVMEADIPALALTREDFDIRLNNDGSRDANLLWIELDLDE